MHILIFPSWYPSNPEDISGIFFKEQAIALSNAGHFISVLKPQISVSKNPIDWSKTLNNRRFTIDQNVKTFSLNFINWSGMFLRNENSRVHSARKWFRKYINKYGRPDVIHAHSTYWGGFLANNISKEFDIPYIITEHASDIARCRSESKTFLKTIYNESSKVVCVSTFLMNVLNNFYEVDSKKTIVIPNLLSELFNENKINKNDSHERFTFLNIAELSIKKRHHLLIEAFAKLVKLHANIELRIGGFGILRSQIENLIKHLNLETSVILLGKLDREKVLEEIAACNAFVLSSEIETFGVVLIEALSQGKPIIATDSGGPRDIVTESNGFLVSLNEEDLIEAMENMYMNYSQFDQNKIREDGLNKYNSRIIISRLESVYKEAINIR